VNKDDAMDESTSFEIGRPNADMTPESQKSVQYRPQQIQHPSHLSQANLPPVPVYVEYGAVTVKEPVI